MFLPISFPYYTLFSIPSTQLTPLTQGWRADCYYNYEATGIMDSIAHKMYTWLCCGLFSKVLNIYVHMS